MAGTVTEPEFLLPSEFLTEDDIIMDINNFNKNTGLKTDLSSKFGFPTEFPCDCSFLGSSSLLSSPVGSPLDSTVTEGDMEDLIKRLTRRTLQENQKSTSINQSFEKGYVPSSSPQSTCTMPSSGTGHGYSQFSSLQNMPVAGNYGSWDLIHQAAGEIARLKMNGDGPPKVIGHLSSPWSPNSCFHCCQSQAHSHTPSGINHVLREKQMLKQQGCNVWGRQAKDGWFSLDPMAKETRGERGGLVLGGSGIGGFVESGKFGRLLRIPQSAGPALQAEQNHHQNCQHQNHQLRYSDSFMRAVLLGGSSGCSGANEKTECAGTGVFLPRRYSNPSESHNKKQKPGCPSKVIQAPNKNFLGMNVHTQSLCLPPVNAASISDYDLLVSGANALFAQHKICPGQGMNPGTCLPR